MADNKIQARVRRLRDDLEGIYPLPEPFDSWAYLVTEVAEVGDQLLRLRHPEHIRGHDTVKQLRKEMGDVQFMLATLANQLDIDLLAETKIACLRAEVRARSRGRGR